MKESKNIFTYEEKFPVEKSLLLVADKVSRKLPRRDQDIGKEAIKKSLKDCPADILIKFEDEIKKMEKQGSKITLGLLEATLEKYQISAGFQKSNRQPGIARAIGESEEFTDILDKRIESFEE